APLDVSRLFWSALWLVLAFDWWILCCSLCALEFDRAFRQQVKDVSRTIGHGRMMTRAGAVNKPACAHANEFRRSVGRNNHADLAERMGVAAAAHRLHEHDIDAEMTRFRMRLDRTAKPDAAGFALADPAVLVALGDERGDFLESCVGSRIGGVQPRLKLGIERAIAYRTRNFTDKSCKFSLIRLSLAHASLPKVPHPRLL